MSPTAPDPTTLAEWIAADAIRFSLDSIDELNAAIDRVVEELGSQVEMLGFGEPMHGADEFLVLRNHLFRRLVEAHGYTAIAIESSFPMGWAVDRYVRGEGSLSNDGVWSAGFGHQMGKLEANRELVEWMRDYNAGRPAVPLGFYGFDMPTAPTGIGGPRAVVPPALEFLAAVDPLGTQPVRERVESRLGDERAWENPAAYFDPSQSIGLTPEAGALRAAIEDLVGEFDVRGPEFRELGGEADYERARQHAVVARGLLNYHAAIAGKSGLGTQLGIRDRIMADNLAYIAARERSGRKPASGKLLVFAHNSHLQRRKITAWEAWRKALNAEPFSWWPAGAHLTRLLGPRYAAIGTAVGSSEPNGIGEPEPESLEARLTEAAGSPDDAGLFLSTARARDLSAAEFTELPARTSGTTNLSYIPLGPQCIDDFDCLAVLRRAGYYRGVPVPPVR